LAGANFAETFFAGTFFAGDDRFFVGFVDRFEGFLGTPLFARDFAGVFLFFDAGFLFPVVAAFLGFLGATEGDAGFFVFVLLFAAMIARLGSNSVADDYLPHNHELGAPVAGDVALSSATATADPSAELAVSRQRRPLEP
jgi:hypothetical protein